MKKTLLFGGSGFFGPVILSKNPDIISVGRTKPPIECKNKHIQLDDLNQINILDNLEFDKVIFLIGSSNHHEINLKNNMGIDLNVYPLNTALSYFEKRKIKKFICFTTILLYDQKKSKLPVGENQEINPFINKYVFSKYLSEQVVKYFSKTVPSIIVRLSNIYGATRLKRPDLIPTIMQDLFEKEKISIWSNQPKRDFIFTEDAADAVIKLIETKFEGIINLGTGKMSSLKEICEIIEELSGKKVISENKVVTGPMEFVTDISKITELTGWIPKHDITSGLKKTYEMMKDYYKE
jgi:UDP-glucose 4-epimerase|tara:strand:+ start:1054 stop:1935 length:882 start_codon:yes stop_codon:yes gene_type:complete